MSRLLRTLKDSANRTPYQGVQLHFVPRGLIYPIDFGGLGQIRFGQKEGSNLPLIRADNLFNLDEDAIYNTDQLILNLNPTWMEPGGFVLVGQKESHEIDDINENIIYLTTPLLSDYVAGQEVIHYSNPIQVEGNYQAGSLVINVDSPYFMVRGDVIAVPKNNRNLFISFDEYQVVDLTLVSFLNDIYQYQITLDRILTNDLIENQVIQLRAYPSYKSQVRPIPSIPGFVRRIAGPFLIDWVSAPLREKLTVEETQTVYFYNVNRSLLEDPRVVEKNYVVLNNPILAEQFLFWQKVIGSINYRNDLQQFVMISNEEGHWRLKYECVPRIQTPTKNATGFIQCVPPSELVNNDNFVLDDTDLVTIFEYMVNAGYVPTPSSVATGYIDINALPIDNQWVTLDDGYGGEVPLEFKRTDLYIKTPGKQTVDVRSAVIATDVAILLREFLESITGLNLIPTVAGNRLNLTHTKVSTKGNQLITFDPTLAAIPYNWAFSGMSGGTNKVVTIDVSSFTTDLEVAKTTSAAITAENLKIRASYPSIIPVVELTSLVPGPTANIPITTTVSSPNWLVSGMSGGTGGFKWNTTLTPDVNSLFRIRFYPNDWQDFNLTGGVANNIVIEIKATDEPVEIIDMLLKTDPETKCYMDQWSLSGPRVAAIAYDYIARVVGNYNFASTTLMIKTLWQSLDDVRAVHDSGFVLDNGYMRA